MSARPTAVPVTTDFQSAVSPTISGFSDFGYLLVEQGITSSFGTAGEDTGFATDGYSNIQKSPLYTTRSGSFVSSDVDGGGFLGQASGGFLWSGTTYSGTGAYGLYYYSNTVAPANGNYRYFGFPVRCIVREKMIYAW